VSDRRPGSVAWRGGSLGGTVPGISNPSVGRISFGLIALRDGCIKIPALIVSTSRARENRRLSESIRVVNTAFEGNESLRIIKLSPGFLELPLVQPKGAIERRVSLDVFDEIRIDPGVFIESFVALLEGFRAQWLVRGPAIVLAHGVNLRCRIGDELIVGLPDGRSDTVLGFWAALPRQMEAMTRS
jgi:hypothetical protein